MAHLKIIGYVIVLNIIAQGGLYFLFGYSVNAFEAALIGAILGVTAWAVFLRE